MNSLRPAKRIAPNRLAYERAAWETKKAWLALPKAEQKRIMDERREKRQAYKLKEQA